MELEELDGVQIVVPLVSGFVPAEHFVVDVRQRTRVKIKGISAQFRRWFLTGQPISQAAPSKIIAFRKGWLRTDDVAGSDFCEKILQQLGGQKRAILTPWEVFTVLEAAASHPSVVEGFHSNMAFVLDDQEILRVVSFRKIPTQPKIWQLVGLTSNQVQLQCTNPSRWFTRAG